MHISQFSSYSTFRAVWIRGAGVKPLRGGVAPTPPVPNSCENRCSSICVVRFFMHISQEYVWKSYVWCMRCPAFALFAKPSLSEVRVF